MNQPTVHLTIVAMNSDDFEEHEKLAYDLRNHFGDVGLDGVSVSHMDSDEAPQDVGDAALVDFSDLDTPEKYYTFVSATEPHNVHLYGVDEKRNQKLMGKEEGLSLDEVKHLLMSIHEWVSGQMKTEKVMKPEQPSQPDKPQPSLKEQQRRYTVAMLDGMVNKRKLNQGRKKLGENFKNIKKSLAGQTKSIL